VAASTAIHGTPQRLGRKRHFPDFQSLQDVGSLTDSETNHLLFKCPYGTPHAPRPFFHPAMNRWAILKGPFGARGAVRIIQPRDSESGRVKRRASHSRVWIPFLFRTRSRDRTQNARRMASGSWLRRSVRPQPMACAMGYDLPPLARLPRRSSLGELPGKSTVEMNKSQRFATAGSFCWRRWRDTGDQATAIGRPSAETSSGGVAMSAMLNKWKEGFWKWADRIAILVGLGQASPSDSVGQGSW